jgi:predicted metallo-beta-lactamase superfamily hydrolase
MMVRIIGSESLGVRSLSCVVETAGRRIVIDPGVALAPQRAGLGPHRTELEAAEAVRRRLRNELAAATHVVITHFHGDHHPMVEADPSQLAARDVTASLRETEILAIGKLPLSKRQVHRRYLFQQAAGRRLPPAEGTSPPGFRFSPPMPHGEPETRSGSVMMVLVEEQEERFAHASDIQLLDDGPVHLLCDWQPTLLLVSGPPHYMLLQRPAAIDAARRRLLTLAASCGQVIVDHHLLRSREGERWLDEVRTDAPNVCCAADFEGRERTLLEADRKKLWGNKARPRR